MAKAKSELNWQEIAVGSLNGELLVGYEHSKAKYREAKAAREAFEGTFRAVMKDSVPVGQRLVFGYNFGKLSVALAPEGEAKPKAKPQVSLADYLAANAQAGRVN